MGVLLVLKYLKFEGGRTRTEVLVQLVNDSSMVARFFLQGHELLRVSLRSELFSTLRSPLRSNSR